MSFSTQNYTETNPTLSALSKAQVYDVGIDYLTCVADNSETGESELRTTAYRVIDYARRNGWRVTPATNMGLNGWATDGLVVVSNWAKTIVRVSGEDAQNSWRGWQSLAHRVTRIDCQVSVTLDEPLPGAFLSAYYQTQTPRGGKGRPAKARVILNSRGGDTLYLGSRQSDLYGRFYDKGVESKSALPGLYFRYETETKGNLVAPVLTALARTQSEKDWIAGYVARFFASRRLDTLETSAIPLENARVPAATSVDQSLLWLKTQVAPTVARLVRGGHIAAVYRALGLADIESCAPGLLDNDQ
jgi:hypothetical protein